MKVLILDDDELFRKRAANLLKRLGAEAVISVEGYDEFQFHLLTKSFNLCIVDILLHGSLNGIECIQRENISCPIWITSSVIRKENIPEDVLSQVSLFLPKPLDECLMASEFKKILYCKEEKKETGIQSSFFKPSYSQSDFKRLIFRKKYIKGHELPLLYCLCSFSSFSGSLILKSKKMKAELFFSNGNMINIRLPHKKSYLGLLLAAHGFAEASDIKKVLKNSKGKLIGQRLVEKGFISPHGLTFMLKEQTKIRMSHLILPQEEFEIQTSEEVLTAGEHFNLEDMRSLIAETLWSKAHVQWLKDYLKDKKSFVVDLSHKSSISEEHIHLEWMKKSKKILSLVNSKSSCSRIIEKSMDKFSFSEEEAYFGLYYLLVCKYVYLKKSSSSLNTLDMQQKILRFKRKLKIKNYFEVLSISSHASDKEIKYRIQSLMKFFHPDQYRFDQTSVKRECNEALFILNEIKSTLLNSSKKEKYLKKLKEGSKADSLENAVILNNAKDLIEKKDFQAALPVLSDLKDKKFSGSEVALHYCWAYLKTVDRFKSSTEENQILSTINRVSVEDKYTHLYYFCKGLYSRVKKDFLLAQQNLNRCLSMNPNFLPARTELAEVKSFLNKKKFNPFGKYFKAS